MTITQSSTRFVAVAAGIALALSLAFAPVVPAQAAGLTSTQIQSILSLLSSFGADQATINNVNAALNGQATTGTGSTGSTSGAACPALTRSLQVGSTGSDVMALQVFLNSNASTQVAASGAGSPGHESTYFGNATKAAVIKFQSAHGVSAIGIVGPATRAAIAAACSGTSTGGTTTGGTTGGTTTGGAVTVSAGAQPVNSLAVAGASRVPFTTFTLTNNSSQSVTVNSVTVQRTGLGVDANFSGIVLLDSNGLQVGNSKTLNSNHQANIGDSGFTLAAGASMTFTVAGNIANSSTAQSGQVISLQVVAINTSATVSGTLPISGASQTVNTTLTLGSVSTSTSSIVPGTSTTHSQNIGDTGVRFSGLKFTAGSAEDLKLYSIRWRQVGSASSVDLGNVVTVVNGTSYPTTVDSSGKYYTTIFPGGILIPKGNNVDVYVQGDLVGSNSAGRTVEFNIDRVTDVYFVGQTYGYGVAPSGTSQPWYTGDVYNINAGTATLISKSNASADAAQNIAVNVPNQPLGGFVTNFTGEPVTVSGMTFSVSTSSTGFQSPITNVSIVDENGAVVAGPVDESGTTLTFSDSVTFPTGVHTYHVRGKIPTGTTNGTTISLNTTPSSQWTNPVGQVSGNTISLSGNGNFALNTMTIMGATTSVTIGSTPAAQNVVAGTQGYTFGTIQLDATQSGEDIRYSSLPVQITGNTGDLSGCQLYDGSTALTTGSRVINTVTNGLNSFTLDNSLTVPKGTVKTISVVCNLSSSATGSHTYAVGVNSTNAWSASGVTSGSSITPTVTTATGGTQTLASASLAVSVDSSSPSYMLAAGGQTGVTVGVVKLRASNEALNLTKLGLTLTSGAAADLSQVYIYNGSTLVGTATFTGSNTSATSTLSTPVTLAKDADTLLTIKADLADIGTSQPGNEGDLVKVDPLNAEATGASSGTTVKVGATAGVAGVRVYNTFPTVALDTLPSTGIADGRLMHFKVTADSHGQVGISVFTFKVATTSATATNVQLFGFTDSAYSQAISGQGTSGQIGNTLSTIATNSNFTITASTPVEVPAGSTYYFELRASVAGVTTGSSVVTTLVGDSSASPSTGTAATSSVSGNFVWSPNATSTVGVNANDYTNGFGISGLPSSGIFQTRSN